MWWLIFKNLAGSAQFTKRLCIRDSKPSSWQIFSFQVSLIAPVIVNEALQWRDSKLLWNDLLYCWSGDNFSITEMRCDKDLDIGINAFGKHFWSLLAIYVKCSPKFNCSCKSKPRCFYYGVIVFSWLLLKINTGCLGFLNLQERITSCTCLEGLELKIIFFWYAQF